MNKKTFKSLGAVVAGFVTVAALSIGTDSILEAAGIFPSLEEASKYGFNTPWMVTLAFLYRSVYTVIGGYITARLAPHRPMKHVVILGIFGTIGALLGLVSTWGKDLGPAWYPIALVLFGFPCVWLGGTIFEANKKK
jgi:hypothetical protein